MIVFFLLIKVMEIMMVKMSPDSMRRHQAERGKFLPVLYNLMNGKTATSGQPYIPQNFILNTSTFHTD
jgi:hypothetical protein